MGESRFNSTAVLDAVPEGELNTARRLREDLEELTFQSAVGLQVRYFRIQTITDLESAISALHEEARLHGLIPWLHLDGHGADDETGFFTADHSFCSWSRLAELVTPLNMATNLNVVIVLATCHGGSFASAIRTNDRAPVLGLIGSTRKISAGEIETDFPSFYKTFFTTGSLKKAISALTARTEKGLYYGTTAQGFFYDVWENYKRTLCTDEQITIRARATRKKLKADSFATTPSPGALKRKFRSIEQEEFERFRDKYFMYDLYPSNRTRFPVTYREAEKYAVR